MFVKNLFPSIIKVALILLVVAGVHCHGLLPGPGCAGCLADP